MTNEVQKVNTIKEISPVNPKGTRKRHLHYERDVFNNHQNFLYKRALFGLSMYEPAELELMHWDKKRRISKVHKHAQGILNIWKQQMINKITNEFLDKIFKNSNIIKDITGKYGNYTDPAYISTVDFKSIGITKGHIIDKLIIEGVLPYDFYELKPLKKDEKVSEKTQKSFSTKARNYWLFKFRQPTGNLPVLTE